MPFFCTGKIFHIEDIDPERQTEESCGFKEA
jgi:hypothetical protein